MSASEQAASIGAIHDVERGEHPHPRAGTYLRIAAILGVLTVLEVWVYTIESLGASVVPVLLGLALVKFLLVVGFYMHLKFDHHLFSYMFGFGLLIAGSIVTALLFLHGQYPLPPGSPGAGH